MRKATPIRSAIKPPAKVTEEVHFLLPAGGPGLIHSLQHCHPVPVLTRCFGCGKKKSPINTKSKQQHSLPLAQRNLC